MEKSDLLELIKGFKENGVEYYKDQHIEIRFSQVDPIDEKIATEEMSETDLLLMSSGMKVKKSKADPSE